MSTSNNLTRYLMIECDVDANEFEVDGRESFPSLPQQKKILIHPANTSGRSNLTIAIFTNICWLQSIQFRYTGSRIWRKHQAYKDSLQREHFLTEKERNKRDKEIWRSREEEYWTWFEGGST